MNIYNNIKLVHIVLFLWLGISEKDDFGHFRFWGMSTNDNTQVSTVHDTVAILSQTREILNDDISTLNYNIFIHNQNQCMNQGRDIDQTALCADQTPNLTEQ